MKRAIRAVALLFLAVFAWRARAAYSYFHSEDLQWPTTYWSSWTLLSSYSPQGVYGTGGSGTGGGYAVAPDSGAEVKLTLRPNLSSPQGVYHAYLQSYTNPLDTSY